MRLKGLFVLTKRGDFRWNKEQGRSFISRSIVLQVSSRKNCEPSWFYPSVGFVVSRRVGGAVKRNLVKRRLRSLAEEFLGGKRNGIIYVLVARKRAAKISFSQLCKDLLFCVEQLNEAESISLFV